MSTGLARAFMAATFCAAATISTQGASAANALATAHVEGREPVKFSYRFNRADLDTREGTQRVYRNLTHDARRACAEERASLADLHRVDHGCVAELVNDVVRRIGSPSLVKLLREDRARGI
jgi:UrcA family protein